MKTRLLIAVLLVAAAGPVLAADNVIAGLEGVYKHRFQNGMVGGERYMSEDLVEIVRVSATEAYLNADLQFYNGHSCGVTGVARVEGHELVLRQPTGFTGEVCVLHARKEHGKLTFQDGGTCRSNCGVRGSFEGFQLPAKPRRGRDLDKVRRSADYRAALAARTGP